MSLLANIRVSGLLLPGLLLACGLAGLAAPFYLDALLEGNRMLLALPLVLGMVAIMVVSRKALLMILLLTRASGDLFLESMRPDLNGDGLGVGAVLNISLILLTISLMLETPRRLPRAMVTMWVAFFVTALVAVFRAPAASEALRLFASWLSYCAAFFAAFYLVQSFDDFRRALRLVLWSSIVPSCYALVEAFLHPGSLAGAYRLQATFTHPNVFAFYLVLVIPIGFYLVKTRERLHIGWRHGLLAMYLVLLTVLLLLTQTRGAWFGLLAIALAYALRFERHYLLYIGALISLAALVPALHDRVIDLATGNQSGYRAPLNSFAWRVSLWGAALGWMEPLHYLFGYGAGAFRDSTAHFFPSGGHLRWDAHNVYVQWFFDAGLLGVLTYLWLHARIIFCVRLLSRVDRLAAFVIVAIALNYLFISISDNMLFYLALNWYHYFVLGAAVSASVAMQPVTAPAAARGVPVWRTVSQRPAPARGTLVIRTPALQPRRAGPGLAD